MIFRKKTVNKHNIVICTKSVLNKTLQSLLLSPIRITKSEAIYVLKNADLSEKKWITINN